MDALRAVALRCAGSRLKRSREDLGERWFVQKANEEVAKVCDPAVHTLRIPSGASPETVLTHLGTCTNTWSNKAIRIAGVDLGGTPELLQQLFHMQRANVRLESIELTACGIGAESARLLQRFVMHDSSGCVTTLVLSDNPLGIEGVGALLAENGALLRKVRKLVLHSADLTAASLELFPKLELDGNELREVEQNHPLWSAFCEMIIFLQLNLLSLRNTRICEPQLLCLLSVIRHHPSLRKVQIQGVNMPDYYRHDLGEGNPLLSAMSDPACSVNHLDISPTQPNTALLHRKLVAAAQRRGEIRTAAHETGDGLKEVQGKSYQVLSFRQGTVYARLRRCEFAHPLFPSRVMLETRFGVFDKAECLPGADLALRDEECGSLFAVNMRYTHERDHVANEIVTALKIDAAAARTDERLQRNPLDLHTFRGVAFVFCRPETHQVLLRVEAESRAAAALKGRLKEGVLADHLAIEDRVAGASKKKQKERFTGEEVMRGLPLDLFSDEEVLNLARLHSVESYSKFLLGMENGNVVAPSAGTRSIFALACCLRG